MLPKQQVTDFMRTEEYDSVRGLWKRAIKPNNLMNLAGSVTNSTTGDVTLASTVVPTGQEWYVYIAKLQSSTITTGQVGVDGTPKLIMNIATANLSDVYTSPSDSPLIVLSAGSTLAVRAIGTTSTGNTYNYTVVAKVEPLPANVEHS